jgi:membrane protein DedA with SNARE-associated domain
MANINYLTITLFMMVESTFIPLPSELLLPPAAWLAAQGEMNLFLIIVFRTILAAQLFMVWLTVSMQRYFL